MLTVDRCVHVRLAKLYDEVYPMSTLPTPFAAREFAYAQVDVFAEGALEGNMLGIFPDARGLADEEMQALARETNLSETTFLMPRDEATERSRGVRVRIFTVQEELPFAGHPTLGTASWLFWNHPLFAGADEIRLELNVGTIPVRFDTADGRVGVFGTMRQPAPVFGAMHERAAVAAAIGMAEDDLDDEMPVQTVSTGMPFCIVPLRSVEAAGRLAIPQAQAERYLRQTDAKFFHCIAPAAPGGGAAWHARMQFHNGEDPATGSASGCAIAYLLRHGRVRSGEAVVIEQGVEMKRPSRIHVRACFRSADGVEGGSEMEVFVGGRTIPVASGRFFLPGR